MPVTITHTAVPGDGVYAGWLHRLDHGDAPYWPAAISVGTNPTFDGAERKVESYVLDRTDLELYGVHVEVVFERRLREMVRFDTIDDLVDQMKRDVDQARDLLTTPPGSPPQDATPASQDDRRVGSVRVARMGECGENWGSDLVTGILRAPYDGRGTIVPG